MSTESHATSRAPTPVRRLAATNRLRVPERFRTILTHGISVASGPYLHWDDLRHRRPPDGLTLSDWWLGMKLSRRAQQRGLPLSNAEGTPFFYGLPDSVLEQLHQVDQRASGEIMLSEAVADQGTRRRYLVNSLMEEAIASSQIEGASTTRRVAKEMLRTGRGPRDVSERIILNNYRAIMRNRHAEGRAVDPGACPRAPPDRHGWNPG